MNREAKKYEESADGKRAFYIDEALRDSLISFLSDDPKRAKKFKYIVNLILLGQYTSEQFGRENIKPGCENVYAIKMFKGTQNVRIYCQKYNDNDVEKIVVIASELLPKKKNQKLKATEISLIEKVAQYTYTLKDE